MMNHHDHHRGRAFLAVLTVLSLAIPDKHARAEFPAAPGAPAAAQLAIYSEKIRPLLAERCFSCHGGLKQEAGLRLDTVALMVEGGESGGVVTKGDPAASLILERVSDTDPVTRMPPEGEGEPLSAEQLAMLKDWIKAGCPAPADEKPEADPKSHWAFQPRVRPEVPAVKNTAWVKNPIDAFLAHKHEEAGIAPQPEAPRHVLVRRLYVDLIGLPPQPEELAVVEADTSTDWYEKLVEKLLADQRHGERWARHWMDGWRYSDWWGLGADHRNSQKHMWHFRDWIVESLNADTGYDEMVRQMLAADELHPDDPTKLRATGFLARNWFKWNRTPWLDDTVEHVGKGLLGLTMNCSKCHAHKYDPIQQEDYYRFRAFFEPIETRLDVVAGEGDLEKDGISRVYDAHLDRPTYLFVRGDDTKPDTSKKIEPGVPEVLAFRGIEVKPVSLPPTAFEPERRPWVLDAHVATARRAVESAEAAEANAAEKASAARTTLAAAEREASSAPAPASSPPSSSDGARALVATAERQLAVARAGLAVERAALESVVRRAEATRIAWETAGASGVANDANARRAEATRAAVRAEREVAVARARQKVIEVENKVATAAPDKKAEADKELAAAREAVEKAVQAVDAAEGTFRPLVGAKWTVTRFKNITGDDPTVPFPATSTGRRSALAHWITDPRNPLTARVAVNHIWMRHIGKPLVATVFEFGRKGNAPTHPELLDWLASELVDGPQQAGAVGGRGWSMKHLHRLICTSAAYRMGSSIAGAEPALKADPDNRLLWRREPIRLEAQVVRDGILALAGTLDTTMGGPPVPEPQQADSRRRSLYFWHSDISQNVFLTTFDDAAVKECYQRDQSIVPQQALALSNAALVHDAAAKIAGRPEVSGSPAGDAAFLERAFSTILYRGPTVDERAACEAAMAKWRTAAKPAAGAADPARVLMVWALLNHNDFVTLR
jgi:hypothetical protein